MTTKCPRCFRTLSADLFAWECAGTCQPMPDPIASANAGIQVLSRPLVKMQRPSDHRRWLPPADQPCSKCHQPSRDVCPYCHYDLLRNWRESDTVTIALAGARATGKTIYVAILVKQLEEMFSRNRLALSFADQRSRKIYEEHYEAPLYEARGIPGPTAPAQVEGAYQRDPIILDMGSLRTGPAMLVIRDVAGEDLERPAADPRYLSYFERADIVLFLFDPSAVRDVRELLKDYLPQEDRITGDPEVVLENLLENAWKFTGGRPVGQIRVGSLQQSGEQAVFFVADNGVGFDPQYAANLFGVFQRLHAASAYPGTGVGLATVQRILQRHGGRIWADARTGEGATFFFTLS